MIEIKDLRKKFGKQEVLKGVNIAIDPGKIYAVLGPNGSGKTTIIKSILGMVIKDSGKITVNDQDIDKSASYRRDIDYLPQIANFPNNLNVQELIKMIKDIRGENPDESHLIQLFGLEPFLKKKLSNLSGGTKQKVNIVLAFMFDSPIIILDEPTSGLDPVAMVHLRELITEAKAKGKLILITSHIISFVEEMADEVIFLLEGVIYFKGFVAALNRQTGEENLEKAMAQLLKSQYA
ncbi:ATP-binding cassette domain-containing protein [Flavobacteriaceae bacterium Ap0902]|nr:ATP-binding cassette domain-containing protein [Flavobacteriaceae bacterium Ap0902]